jgi:microcystin degradation protein MlrC
MSTSLRIFTGGLETETNTFSPLATGRIAFERNGLGQPADEAAPEYYNAPIVAWRRNARAQGHVVIESIMASAEPAGRILQPVYEELRDVLLADLRRAMPVDVVLLNLHGAMASTDDDDCEGDLLRRVREIVGPQATVGAELDLHCHLTDTMLEHATAIVAYKEYPHDDIEAMAEDLYRLCVDAALGRTRPVMRMYDCRMVGIWPTTREPIRSFVARMRSLERDGILSISFGHGFPWGDVASVGAKMLVIADGDPDRAAACALTLGSELWALREAARYPVVPIDDALDEALAASSGPFVFADGADNAGGGAPADSTFVLRRMLERGVRNATSAAYYDPMSVALCFEAGPGTTLELRVGGKLGVTSGAPLDVRARVRAVRGEHEQHSLVGMCPLGRAAWIEVDGIDIVLVSVRTQVFAPDVFTGLGITLDDKRIVVVKSINHFYRNFESLAQKIVYLNAPGALRFDFENIPYTKRDSRYWPRVQDPFAQPELT